MEQNIKRFNSSPLEYLSLPQMRDIHSATLRVMTEIQNSKRTGWPRGI